MKCKNSECNNEVDALSMDDEGYCDTCHNKMLDECLITESDETKFLSDRSLEIICSTSPVSRVSRVSRYRSRRR